MWEFRIGERHARLCGLCLKAHKLKFSTCSAQEEMSFADFYIHLFSAGQILFKISIIARVCPEKRQSMTVSLCSSSTSAAELLFYNSSCRTSGKDYLFLARCLKIKFSDQLVTLDRL